MKLALSLLLSIALGAGQSIPFPGPGMVHSAGAITLGNHTSAGSADGTTVTTAAIVTTGASLLLAACSHGGSSTLSDSASNTWVPLMEQAEFGQKVQFFYVASPVTSGTHTFSCNGGTIPSIAVAAYSGTSGSPFDQENGAVGISANLQTGSITPSANGYLVAAATLNGGAGTISVDSGMTIIEQVAFDGALHEGIAFASLIQTTAAAINPTFTNLVTPLLCAIIASFAK